MTHHDQARDSQDTIILNSLIATTIDSAKGFEDSAERASDSQMRTTFSQFARDRRQMAQRLMGQVSQMGDSPEDKGTLKGTAHRRWLDLKNAIGRGDRAILNSVEAGETYIREKYEMALKERSLSPDVRKEIEGIYTSILGSQAELRTLRSRAGDSASGGDWGKTALVVGGLTVAGFAAARSLRKSPRDRDGSEDADFALKLETDENMRLISSTKVEGTPVFGRDGARLGRIESFMVDKYSGRVGYAVMTFGGTMGFGAHHFPLPWSTLTYDEDQKGYVVPLSKEDFADAPRFEANDAPEFDPAYRRQILVFYRGTRGSTGSSGSQRSGRFGSQDDSSRSFGAASGITAGTGSNTATGADKAEQRAPEPTNA